MNCALPILLSFVLPWAYAIRTYIFLISPLFPCGHDASCPYITILFTFWVAII